MESDYTMKDFIDIALPTESADNYYMNQTKNQVNNFIYIEQSWYEKLFEPNTYYILGPKGSGKTLYAAYMCADIRKETVSKSHTIDVGDYGKLIAMKTSNHLNFTDYMTMWKVILLQKFLLGLDATEISFFGRAKNFKSIQETISQYFGYDVTDDSFNPVTVIDSCGKQIEVTNYLNDQLELTPLKEKSSGIILKREEGNKSASITSKSVERVAATYTDTWLRAIDAFRRTISKISFKFNHYLFVDGLDVRPQSINEVEYAECIGALVRAVFDLNTKIFGNIEKRDNHSFKIIALTRTDIFLNSELVNVTSCINDNCVELDWTYSNEKEFYYSNLYKMMNRVLGWDGKNQPFPAEEYFNFSMAPKGKRPIKADLYIQRYSRLRPRDIVVYLRLLQRECRAKGVKNPDKQTLNSPEVIARYANYYTDQVKSEMTFSYSSDIVKSVFELLKALDRDSFSLSYFQKIFDLHCENNALFSAAFSSYRDLINVLYSLDVIGWTERVSPRSNGPRHYRNTHWHYREVKAIDETYRFPWEQFSVAYMPRLLVHRGATKHILGFAKA